MIKLKILFKNTTQYTKKVYDKFLEFHRKKYRIPYIAFNVIIIACILFCLILQIQYHNFNVAILICVILTVFVLWRYLHPIFEIEKEYKSDKIKKEKVFTFKFYDNYMTCEDLKHISKYKYYRLRKIFETDDFFYIYLNKSHAFLLDKSSFSNNCSSDFSIFIKKKCLMRYSKVIKKQN